MYPSLVICYFPYVLGDFGMFLDEKCSWSFYEFFMNVLHCS